MKKKIMAAMLAALVLSQGMATFAKPATNNPTGEEHTTIGIMESTTNVGQASFEVPLYVTTAAITQKADLVCPEGYDITNTAGTNGGRAIGVVSVTVDRLDNATWNTVKAVPTTNKDDVQLSIGDLVLPVVNATTKSATVKIATDGQNTAFYDDDNNKIQAIANGQTLSQAAGGPAAGTAGYKGLGITGKIAKIDRTDKGAAAQFRIRYVISALDAAGDPVGSTYVGDDKTAAGF